MPMVWLIGFVWFAFLPALALRLELGYQQGFLQTVESINLESRRVLLSNIGVIGFPTAEPHQLDVFDYVKQATVLKMDPVDQTECAKIRSSGPEAEFLLEHQHIATSAFSPSGRYVAFVYSCGIRSGGKYQIEWQQRFQIWDIRSGKRILNQPITQYQIYSVAFSFDEQILAAGSGDGLIRLYKASTGKSLQTIAARQKVYSVGFVYGKPGLLLSDGAIWNFKTGKQIAPLEEPQIVEQVGGSPVISRAEVFVHSLQTGQVLPVWRNLSRTIRGIDGWGIDPKRTLVAIVMGQKLLLYEANSAKLLTGYDLNPLGGYNNRLTFTKDATQVALTTSRSGLRIFNIRR